jgi:hypothetical protein
MAPATKKAPVKKTTTKKATGPSLSKKKQDTRTASVARSHSQTSVVDEHEADGTHAGNVLDLDDDVVMELDDQPDAMEIDDDKELGTSVFTEMIQTHNRRTTAKLKKEWTAPVYAFFDPEATIEYVDGRRSHVFRCTAKPCKMRERNVRRFLDKGDAKSTSNLRKHAKKCWGDHVVASADNAECANEVRDTGVGGQLSPGLITAAFERSGKGKITYSHVQHTRTKSR